MSWFRASIVVLAVALAAAPAAHANRVRAPVKKLRQDAGKKAQRPIPRRVTPKRSARVVHGRVVRARRFRRAPTRVAHLLRRATTVAFDLDNTLFDTRPRTVLAVHRFARHYQRRISPGLADRLSKTSVADVDFDWRQTAEALGIPRTLRRPFKRIWMETFWSPESFVHDQPVQSMVALVREARAAGKTVRFVTGRRNDLFRGASEAQLRRAGLWDVARNNLYLKPAGSTPRFKAKLLEGWARRGESIVMIDDSTATIRAIERVSKRVRGVAVDFPVNDRKAPPLALSTPSIAVRP